jgi:hypothetical protein
MIGKKDINCLYDWAKQESFPTRNAETSDGYSNYVVKHYWIKNTMKNTLIRKKILPDNIFQLYQNKEILYSGYIFFGPGTILRPHKDPDIYKEPYKRIQIPLEIPDSEKCYMIWNGKKVFWTIGVPQMYDVMDFIHEGYNLSDKPMTFLFVDVTRDCMVEIE